MQWCDFGRNEGETIARASTFSAWRARNRKLCAIRFPGCRIGRDHGEYRRHRISRQPQLRIIIVIVRVACQRRCGAAEIMRRKGLKAEQFADARVRTVPSLFLVPRSAVAMALRSNAPAPRGLAKTYCCVSSVKASLMISTASSLKGCWNRAALLHALERHVKARILAVEVVQLAAVGDRAIHSTAAW